MYMGEKTQMQPLLVHEFHHGILTSVLGRSLLISFFRGHFGVELLKPTTEGNEPLLKSLWHHSDAVVCCSVKDVSFAVIVSQHTLKSIQTLMYRYSCTGISVHGPAHFEDGRARVPHLMVLDLNFLEAFEISLGDNAVNRLTGDELCRFVSEKRSLSMIKLEGARKRF